MSLIFLTSPGLFCLFSHAQPPSDIFCFNLLCAIYYFLEACCYEETEGEVIRLAVELGRNEEDMMGRTLSLITVGESVATAT